MSIRKVVTSGSIKFGKMSIALPINRHMFIDRRKSISSVFPKRQSNLKKVDEGHQKSAQLAKRRQSTPHVPLQDVLFGQALFKISDTVRDLCTGIPVDPLPKAAPTRSKGVPHAPKRELDLTPEQEKVVISCRCWFLHCIYFYIIPKIF